MELKSQFSPLLTKVKRRLEYNSPLKEKLLLGMKGVSTGFEKLEKRPQISKNFGACMKVEPTQDEP